MILLFSLYKSFGLHGTRTQARGMASYGMHGKYIRGQRYLPPFAVLRISLIHL